MGVARKFKKLYCGMDSRLMHHQEQPTVFGLSYRKVKYLNAKGSLVDEHTVKGITKAGKEVGFQFTVRQLFIHLVLH